MPKHLIEDGGITQADLHAPGSDNQNLFSKIAVAAQTDIEANSATDTLNIASADAHLVISTNPTTDTLTLQVIHNIVIPPTGIEFGNAAQEYDISGTTWVSAQAGGTLGGIPGLTASHLLANCLSAIEISRDLSYLAVRELAGAASATNPSTVQFIFTGITDFDTIETRSRYVGSGGHNVNLQLWNWTTSAFDTYSSFALESDYVTRSIDVFSHDLYIGTGGNVGKVILQFIHTSTGNTAHYILFDYVTLNNGGGGSGATIASGIPATAHGNIAATNVQGQLEELETEKLALAGGTMTGGINFATYKAVAMACDNGATVPTSPAPVAGQWFLHTPTGRKVLMQYDGSAWIPIINIGATTIYIDKTDGTDATDKGGAVDAGAFKTIQYAINSIAGQYSGNIVVNINSESYTEQVVLRDKKPTGNFSFTIQGTLNVAKAAAAQTSSVQGATTTLGSISDTGNLGAYDNMLLYSSNNAEYRIIDSDTVNTATVVGYWTAAPTGNYTIYNWGTVIAGTNGSALKTTNIVNLIINDISFTQTTSAELNLYLLETSATVNRCKHSASVSGNAFGAEYYTVVTFNQCYMDGTGGGLDATITTWSSAIFNRCKFYKGAYGIYIASNARAVLSSLCILDGASVASSNGVYAAGPFTSFNGGLSYNIIKGWADYGVRMTASSLAIYCANNQYSSNGTNTFVEATTVNSAIT